MTTGMPTVEGGGRTAPPGQFPLGYFPLPCSVRVIVRVRFMVWVRGMSERRNIQGEMLDIGTWVGLQQTGWGHGCHILYKCNKCPKVMWQKATYPFYHPSKHSSAACTG